ncbi:hypothetical protein ACSQ67_025310 [Phaseolus vulgaris]
MVLTVSSIRRLPSRFNLDLLKNCSNYPLLGNLCPYLGNHGPGQKTHNHLHSWYRTDSSMLELIFHHWMMELIFHRLDAWSTHASRMIPCSQRQKDMKRSRVSVKIPIPTRQITDPSHQPNAYNSDARPSGPRRFDRSKLDCKSVEQETKALPREVIREKRKREKIEEVDNMGETYKVMDENMKSKN